MAKRTKRKQVLEHPPQPGFAQGCGGRVPRQAQLEPAEELLQGGEETLRLMSQISRPGGRRSAWLVLFSQSIGCTLSLLACHTH